MDPIPIPMVLIGFFFIIVHVSASAYEPSASSPTMPIEELIRDSPVLEESNLPLLPAAPGCRDCSVVLPKLGLSVSNSTTKTLLAKCASSTTATKKASSLTPKDTGKMPTEVVTTRTAPVAAPKTSAKQDNIETLDDSATALEEFLDAPVEMLREDVEQTCAHHDDHDQKVVCMVHEVLKKRGHIEPLIVEKDGHKVQVVTMLQEEQVLFEDKMADVALLLE